MGASGAGKSTLARCVNLLERPTSGTITVDGTNLAGLRPRELQQARRAIGTIFQASSLFARRTVAGNVALPLECNGSDRTARQVRVAELLERVGLTDSRRRLPPSALRRTAPTGRHRPRIGVAPVDLAQRRGDIRA